MCYQVSLFDQRSGVMVIMKVKEFMTMTMSKISKLPYSNGQTF